MLKVLVRISGKRVGILTKGFTVVLYNITHTFQKPRKHQDKELILLPDLKASLHHFSGRPIDIFSGISWRKSDIKRTN
jgi:hypothetical protein